MNFNNNRDELDSIEDIIFPISSSFIEDPELNFLNGRLQELTEHCKLLKNLSW
ncbi:hypothetical protein [Leuconostoc mesenteroides]|uniref:hypothetical protein n=1 Tax=Leuconostoc mesenteroides TaxID=1245 RepID=UPI00235E9827|nr:hypothetical protein [Leuconostoc mesenteroides]